METKRAASMVLLEHFQGVVADLTDGSLWNALSPPVQLPRGGLFCDQPGLGKTITALSLIITSPNPTPHVPDGNIPLAWGDLTGYRDTCGGRYQTYGPLPDVVSRSRRLIPHRRGGRGKRPVRAPDYFQTSKGLGSLPDVRHTRDIVLSSGTLAVVPPVLITHWMHQISIHFKKAIITVLPVHTAAELPHTAAEIATYDLVIVSLQLLSHLFQQLRHSAPVLLQVHFYRLIVDEGHKLSSNHRTHFSTVCQKIRADVRWVMTGTPTPTSARSDIHYLHSLLAFIRDEQYGLDKDAWKVAIRQPFLAFRNHGLIRLTNLLRRVMIRADKTIIKHKCIINNVLIHFKPHSAASYNFLVRITRRNLITSDWYSPEHNQSLLNKKNTALAHATVFNLRKACCFGGGMDAKFTDSQIVETLHDLYTKHRQVANIQLSNQFKDPTVEKHLLYDQPTDPNDEAEMLHRADIQKRVQLLAHLVDTQSEFLRLRMTTGTDRRSKTSTRFVFSGKLQDIGHKLRNGNAVCAKCNTHTLIPFITPCAHFLCEQCLTLDRNRCVADGCNLAYKLDKKGVPEQLIELQPALHVDQWRDDWLETKSGKMAYLTDRILSLPDNEVWHKGEAKPRMERPKVIVHSEYGDHLKLVALSMQLIPELKNAYVEMVVNEREIDQSVRKFKIASQHAAYAVERFTKEKHLTVLLINSKHGAVGLDLSFVQYIFLLEPVWDPANELQIISRAHRIGCKTDIIVERLVMRGSIEECLLSDLEASASGMPTVEAEEAGMAGLRSEREHKKLGNLLQNLHTVYTKEELEKEKETRPQNGNIAVVEQAIADDDIQFVPAKRKRDPEDEGGANKATRVRFA